MNLSLYAAASGMDAQQQNLNAISNNIANVNTTGYKKSKMEFQDLLYQTTRPIGAQSGGGQNIVPTGVQMGNGTQVISSSKIFTQGQLTQTDNTMDIAIEGDGFFEVQLPDGSLAYTRDGALKIDSQNRVVTNDGYPVQGGWQPIAADRTNLYISPNGDVTVETPNGSTTFQITLSRFANPAGLKCLGGNLFSPTSASGTAESGQPNQSGYGAVRQGYLETSNVNVVQEMVNMIIAQRAYEINSKSIQTADDMLSRVSQLKR